MTSRQGADVDLEAQLDLRKDPLVPNGRHQGLSEDGAITVDAMEFMNAPRVAIAEEAGQVTWNSLNRTEKVQVLLHRGRPSASSP
jgi:hypothetical protein